MIEKLSFPFPDAKTPESAQGYRAEQEAFRANFSHLLKMA